MEQFVLKTPYVTLSQLLKVYGIVTTGGQVKQFLKETVVTVNGVREFRRGRKLMSGDRVSVAGWGTIVLTGPT